ncbi:28205_t:CDS:2 [Dentiscutata erythropus]|uniref:28205_t:CDS:1 n=1 Tax=Dentiscutata erythropus TaxID=1348616 RepID=A0A9N9NAG3_9GLOM|nr:28205_t:CDS:2 [Dentiscutata erythropus]
MAMEKYIICLDKPSQKEKAQKPAQESDISDNSVVTQQSELTSKKLKLGRLAKQSLRFNSAWRNRYPWLEDKKVDDEIRMFCTWCQEINAKNIFAQGGCKDIRQQNLFSSFTIQYEDTKAKALASMRNIYFLSKHYLALNIFPDLCNLVNFIHLNYNEITYQRPPCILNPPHLHLENNNNFDSTNEENYATYQNPVAGISTSELLLFVTQYATNMITSLRNRFPDSNLYHALRIVDPHKIPAEQHALNSFGQKEIIFLGNYYDKDIESEYGLQKLTKLHCLKNGI